MATLTFKEMEREGWHEKAPHYDARAGRMTREAAGRLLDAVGARPGMRILDVCSGPGYVAGKAAARGLTAVGVDLAPAMVEEARRLFPDAEYREGDAEKLDFPDASFDAVVCAFGMLHLPEPERAIAEAFRVLRPGGRYAFTVWCTPDRAQLLGLAMTAISAHADMTVPLPPAPSPFQFSDPQFAAAALGRAGFREPGSETIPISYRGGSPEDVIDWFDKSAVRTMAVFRLQAPAVQARIREAMISAARGYVQPGGALEIPCTAVLYHAAKP